LPLLTIEPGWNGWVNDFRTPLSKAGVQQKILAFIEIEQKGQLAEKENNSWTKFEKNAP
jgi:hypothetical protein